MFWREVNLSVSLDSVQPRLRCLRNVQFEVHFSDVDNAMLALAIRRDLLEGGQPLAWAWCSRGHVAFDVWHRSERVLENVRQLVCLSLEVLFVGPGFPGIE